MAAATAAETTSPNTRIVRGVTKAAIAFKGGSSRGGTTRRNEKITDNLWEPPNAQLRRRLVSLDVVLPFPLELSIKDYQHRIYRAVARGISAGVVAIRSWQRLTDLCGDRTYDLRALLFQILGRKAYKQECELHRAAFACEFQCDASQLANHAEVLASQLDAFFGVY